MELWIEDAAQFTSPISGDSIVGEDPRYSDEFSELKSEIEKKSDVDFEKIKALSESILSHTAKDIRVVGYLILALSRLDGLQGLGKGMAILYSLVDCFGEELLPTKAKARNSAVRWFQQERLLTFAQSATKSVTAEEANAALTAYDSLFESLSAFSGEPMSWPELKNWLTEQKALNTPVVQPEDDTERKSLGPGSGGQQKMPSAPSVSGGSFQSKAEYAQGVKALINYFKEQDQYAKAYGVAFACQWGGLKLPPNEQGVTRLPAPREASLNRIRNAVDNDQWQEGLVACLDALMEPSGQFCLDIIRSAYDCASRSGSSEVAENIKVNIQTLVERLPKITQLHFDSGEAFVSSVTVSWIDQLRENNVSPDAADKLSIQGLLGEARTLLSSEGFATAVVWLSDQPTHNELERVQVEFSKAQLCIEQDRSDLALPLLMKLEKQVEDLSLSDTSPDVAMQIWRQLYRVLKDQSATFEQDADRMETERHMAQLQSLMCTTDVASAIQWL